MFNNQYRLPKKNEFSPANCLTPLGLRHNRPRSLRFWCGWNNKVDTLEGIRNTNQFYYTQSGFNSKGRRRLSHPARHWVTWLQSFFAVENTWLPVNKAHLLSWLTFFWKTIWQLAYRAQLKLKNTWSPALQGLNCQQGLPTVDKK